MIIDYEKRKYALANARKTINDDQWSNYLEKCYPEWWKQIYGNKWRVNIIYYDGNNGLSNEYSLYIDKNLTMYQIMLQFHTLLLFQKSAIKMCFGNDISGNIIKYLPKSEFDIENNYIYVHKRIFNVDGSIDFKRYPVPNNRMLMHLCGDLCQQNTTNLNLRIRKNPKLLNQRDFTKVFAY